LNFALAQFFSAKATDKTIGVIAVIVETDYFFADLFGAFLAIVGRQVYKAIVANRFPIFFLIFLLKNITTI